MYRPKVCFVSQADETLASYRMRVLTPIEELNRAGNFDAFTEKLCNDSADINVFSKHFNMAGDASSMMHTRTKTIMDICDDHFDREVGPYYEHMATNAHEVTCNSENMQERIYQVTGKLAHIIQDPVTFPEGEFRYNPDEPKVLWFGHAGNLFSLTPYLRKIPNLTIITNIWVNNLPPTARFMLWKPGLVESRIHSHDICILPRNNDPWAKMKSPNRAADAINAGLFVVTDFPEVYGTLKKGVWTGSILDGILFYKNNENRVRSIVTQGQQYVKDHYSPEQVRKKWETTLAQTLRL